jgi:hypothetical protein
MNAIILCPGPSLNALSLLRQEPRADFIVGVNRAATRFRCDYWAALDWPLVEAQHANVRWRPVLITKRENHEHLRAMPNDGLPGGWFAVENIRDKIPDEIGYTNFSATAALAWCLSLPRMREVTVFGADWAPDAPDFDGVMASANRTADRFKWEMAIWERLCKFAAGRGVLVSRVGKEG